MKHIRLNDRYDLNHSRIFVNGAQAIVRLALMQQERDVRAGLNTAGYITGYRGSPLGGLDLQLEQAEEFLAERSISILVTIPFFNFSAITFLNSKSL